MFTESDIKALNIEGDETITLAGVKQHGNPHALDAFMKLKQQEAENRKMLSSGINQTVISKSMLHTTVYGASFVNKMPLSSFQSDSSSTHITTTSPLTGSGSSSTFAATARRTSTEVSSSASCSSSSSSSATISTTS